MFNVGHVITIVTPNKAQDPIKLHEMNRYYNPLMMYSLTIASEVYTDPNNNFLCVDVFGDSGTANQGLTENTRKVYLMDLGIFENPEDREHMECGGITTVFFNSTEAIDYFNNLLNDNNYQETMKNSLEMWGVWGTAQNKEQLKSFINSNNNFKKYQEEQKNSQLSDSVEKSHETEHFD